MKNTNADLNEYGYRWSKEWTGYGEEWVLRDANNHRVTEIEARRAIQDAKNARNEQEAANVEAAEDERASRPNPYANVPSSYGY